MTDQATDTTRWQGFTHKDLYRLLHEGAGPAASALPSRRWAELSSTLTEVGDDLRAAIGRSSSGWAGQAAGAAYDRLSGLVEWASRTGSGAADMRARVETQAEHLARARAEMPVPDDAAAAQPDPTAAAALQVLGAQSDLEPVEQATSAGQQKAFEVMTAYQRDTATNTGGMSAFGGPATLLTNGTVLRHHTGGVQGTTAPALSLGLGLGGTPGPEHHAPADPGRHHDDSHWRDWTSAAGAGEVDLPHRALPGPGSYTGASSPYEPLFGIGGWGSHGWDRESSGRTSTGTGTGTPYGSGAGSTQRIGGAPFSGSSIGVGGPGGAAGGTGGVGGPGGVAGGGGPAGGIGAGGSVGGGTTSGTGLPGAGGAHSPDIQSAAASQMATAAGTPAAAAPGAAAGTGATTAGQDKNMMRRFGADAIGSGQWFGDPPPEPEVRGAAPTRRRRSYTDRPVTESVSVDGEEHQLPPTVIGDGPV